MVVAFDPSPSRTGFAYGDGNSPPTIGSMEHSFAEHEQKLRIEVFKWALSLVREVGGEYAFVESVLIYTKRINILGVHKQFAVYNSIALACGDIPIRRVDN